MNEFELKFDVSPSARRALMALAALPGKPRRTRMRSIYFDTPAGDLEKNGMALRLRREAGRWVQTLKAGAGGTGGVHSRGEWEFGRRGPTLDTSLLAGTPFASLGSEVAAQLAPRFEVLFTREAWNVEPAAGSKLEVALDLGAVHAGTREHPIAEVEIECLEGAPAQAFELAGRLMAHVELRASRVSKAERGYRLLRGERAKPVKARKLRLDASLTPADAARAIVGAGLDQLLENDAGLETSSDPEYVHQARVAMRRMRSALRMFRREIGLTRAKAWRGTFGETSRALGHSRDWDVFALHTLPAALEAYGDAALAASLRRKVARRRRHERQAAREALRSPNHAVAVLELSQWLAHADPGEDPPSLEALVDFAARVIRKRRKDLLAGALMLATLTVEEQHRVRIDAKRLRYALDALGSLFKPEPLETFSSTVEALQDALGDCNDAATATRLLAQLDAPQPFVDFARGWFGARARSDAALLEPIVADLTRRRGEWLRKA
ncbi:MAG TPA: CHAD domain-containing protein [Usitatibacter sp.]|nr:CHAD domain-containing protein [Usitatibacter sp.]